MLKKILIFCVVLLSLVGIYAAAGFYLLPKLAVDKLPEIVSETTGRPFKLQAAHFDPFELKADLRGISLLQDDETPLISAGELSVDVDVIESIKRRAVILNYVTLREPFVDIERNANGGFNFDQVLEKISQPGEDASRSDAADSGPLILIRRMVIEQGQVDWTDFPLGRKETESLQTIDFALTEFSTAPDAVWPFSITCKLKSGGGLDLRGDFNLSKLSAKGNLKLDNLALRKAWLLFLQEFLPIVITDGYVSLNANYAFNAGEGSDLQLLVDGGDITVRQFVAAEKNEDEPLLRMPFLEATGIRLNLLNQNVEIKQISGSNSEIKAWLQADGQINYQSLFADESEQAAAPDSASGRPWQFSLNQLNLDNYRIAFTDFSQAKPVEMVFDQMSLALRDYRNIDTPLLPMKFETRFNNSGKITLDGNIGLAPLSANFAVGLQGVKLKTFQTYVDPYVNLELTDGDFNTQGNLQVKQENDEYSVNYQGDANIASLITRDKVKNLDFVKWGNLELKQIALDVTKQDFKFGKVVFDQPYVRFTINKDRSNNVSDVIVSKDSNQVKAVADKAKKTASPNEPVVTIGKIEFKHGQSDFADYSLILPFVVKMNHLEGEIDGFTSNTDNALKLRLQGKVRDMATVKIGGQYQLKSGDSDITMSFSHLPLPLVTPYMAEFAGYRIEKGQMALDLKYGIKANRLIADNKIFIDQLVLGEKVENPKAVSLPLEFAVALLKDASGKINLDFPITGSLDDPEFSVGSLISDVLINLVKKTVSAPFHALASVFDTADDLSTVSFAAGSSELAKTEIAKLDQIVKGLAAKPELVLEIKGAAYRKQDWPVMRYDALLEILKKMKSGELRDRGEKIRSEYIELSDAEYKRLLEKFYTEVFPQKIDHSLFGTPRIKNKPDADFYSAARDELEAVMKPDPERLNELAVSRANRIVKYLTDNGGIDRSRIYILATEVNTSDSDSGIDVHLSLNVAS
ncbi:DUF748 domain-containing protein [Methylomonas sp. MgM2]